MEVHGGSLTSRCTPARNQWKREGDTFRSRNRCLIIFSRMKAKLTLIIVASQSVFLSIFDVTTKEPKMLEHRSRIKECVEKWSDRPIYMILISETSESFCFVISHHEVSLGSPCLTTYAFYNTKMNKVSLMSLSEFVIRLQLKSTYLIH